MTRHFTLTVLMVGALAGALAAALAPTRASAAASYDLWWNTVDGGGAMKSVSGAFELSGTFGQPDSSGPLAGSTFSLSGGFWITDSSAGGGGDCPGGCPPPAPNEQPADDFTTDFKTHFADKSAPCGGCGGLDAAFFGAGLAGYALFVTGRRRRR